MAALSFALPGFTVASLGAMVGGYALVDGAAAVIASTRAREQDMSSPPFAVEGALSALLAVGAFVARDTAPWLLLPLVAAWAIAAGVFRIASAAHVHRRSHEWLITASGALAVALGLVVMQYPDAASDSVVWTLGTYAGAVGLMFVACGIRLRRVTGALTA